MPLSKKKISVLGIVFVFAFILFLYMNHQYPTPTPFPRQTNDSGILIAHAGGAIDAVPYTNSLEAVKYSIQKGFKFIELDLALTADNHIVAAHDWEMFNNITGYNGTSSITLSEFKQRVIHNKYTPLTYEGINALAANNDICLVTDKIDKFDLLLDQLTISREKLLVEVFSYAKYAQALRKGVKYPMLCIWDKERLHRSSYLFTLGRVAMITVPERIIPEIEAELRDLFRKGIAIFAFSSNDAGIMQEYIGKCVTGFYTDTVSPDHLSLVRN